MLLHESRRAARSSPEGDIVLLEDQDRSRWNRQQIAEGKALVEQALATRRFGAYTLQAAIAAVHAEAPSADATDWRRSSACTTSWRGRPLARGRAEPRGGGGHARRAGGGTCRNRCLLADGTLDDYHLAHAARADLCRRLGRTDDARRSYRKALDLARQEPERRFLEKRLAELA